MINGRLLVIPIVPIAHIITIILLLNIHLSITLHVLSIPITLLLPCLIFPNLREHPHTRLHSIRENRHDRSLPRLPSSLLYQKPPHYRRLHRLIILLVVSAAHALPQIDLHRRDHKIQPDLIEVPPLPVLDAAIKRPADYMPEIPRLAPHTALPRERVVDLGLVVIVIVVALLRLRLRRMSALPLRILRRPSRVPDRGVRAAERTADVRVQRPHGAEQGAQVVERVRRRLSALVRRRPRRVQRVDEDRRDELEVAGRRHEGRAVGGGVVVSRFRRRRPGDEQLLEELERVVVWGC